VSAIEDYLAKDASEARVAYERQDFDALPEEGRAIFERMRTSTLRSVPDENYAKSLAWRAIGQKYGLIVVTPTVGAKSVMPFQAERPSTLVVFNRERGAETVTVRLGDDPASVTVSRVNGQWKALWVAVPERVANASNAGRWVGEREHKIAAVLALLASRKEKRWGRQTKFYLRPEQAKRQIVYGEAYVPWEVDLQREYATEDEVMDMAHGFMLRRGKVGEMHGRWMMPDGQPPGQLVESFVARWGDPHFTPGSWCVGVKAHRDIWSGILQGKYRGWSIGGRWGTQPIELEMVLRAEEPMNAAA
jgi:hypothetical protein